MNYRLIAAAVILALYAALAMVLLIYSGGWTDTHWTHALTIFTSFGAMATAAASVLLGIEVQQTNVEGAQLRAETAVAQLAALREVNRIALSAADGTIDAITDASAEARLAQMRALLANAADPVRHAPGA